MIPVVFINCRLFPFIAWILAGRKLYETRTRNTLRALVGQRVFLAETGRGGRPVIRASAVITEAFPVDNRKSWNKLRRHTMVMKGSVYDWNDSTRRKWLYKLDDVQPVNPFVPPEGVRHGRVWMELLIELLTK